MSDTEPKSTPGDEDAASAAQAADAAQPVPHGEGAAAHADAATADMADPTLNADASEPPDGSGDDGTDTDDDTPPKPPGKIRWWGLAVVVVLTAIAFGLVPLVLNPLLESMIRSGIVDRGLELDDQTTIDVSILDGAVAITTSTISERHEEEVRTVYASPRTAVDLSVVESVRKRDAIIDELTATEVIASLRRFADGSVPGLPDEPPADTDEPPADGEEPPDRLEQARDLYELWERWQPWLERAWRHRPQSDGKAVATPSPNHPAAIRYLPVTGDGAHARWLPRVIIHELELSGSQLSFPDAMGEVDGNAAALDLDSFRIAGHTVATALDAGEEMLLEAELTTVGGGSANAAFRRTVEEGELRVQWASMPLEALATEAAAGRGLAAWGPSGHMSWDSALTWTGADLDGSISCSIIDLKLNPTSDAPAEAAQVAQGLRQLEELWTRLDSEIKRIDPNAEDLGPLVFALELELGGKVYAPTVSGLGADGMLAAIAAQRELIQQRLTQALRNAAGAAVDRVRDQATDAAESAARDALDNLRNGESPEGGARETLENLRESGGDQLDNLRDALPRW